MNITSVYVARLPEPGPLTFETYDLREEATPELDDREILIRVIYLSVDAGSRGMLDDRGAYVLKLKPGMQAIGTGAVGEVVESRHPDFPIGSFAATIFARWGSHMKAAPDDPASPVFAVDPQVAPLDAHLGALGLTGFTAYTGIFLNLPLAAGETAVISAAAGAVGAVAGQYAKIRGARVIGIAGGSDKCEYVRSLGFDDCIDYRSDLEAGLRRACPDGIDFYFENVGGDIQRLVLSMMRRYGRMSFCGQIAQYAGEGEPPGPNLMRVVLQELTLKGFLCMPTYTEKFGQFRAETMAWLKEGRVRHDSSVIYGLENAHEAVNALSAGRNVGKQLIQVAVDPTAQ
ncbi:MAG: NADP-dependent oxidoreductase [Sphingomonadaceae bacterium]|nr:NADP-dependent oxidoreductase [Sphingomonadaceae bacterium]